MKFELHEDIKNELIARGIPFDQNPINDMFNNCMTVFYSTLTGVIFSVMTGEQTMDIYDGDIDRITNRDCKVIPFDGLLLKELHMYYFDLKENRIRLKQEYTKYI